MWATSFVFPFTEDDIFLNIVAMKYPGESDEDILGNLQMPLGQIEKLSGAKAAPIQLWNDELADPVEAEVTLGFAMKTEEAPIDGESSDKKSKKKDKKKGLDYIRSLVSKKKCRYMKEGFDLDLSYVGPRLIAMGFPSEGVESAYRNPMPEVQRFLESKHGGHFAVYNLCSERAYPEDRFPIVKRFPFDDHNPCPFDILVDFCKDVKNYLDENPKNVAAIHCKAGKGRTGLTISAYLLYAGIEKTADDALRYFASKRTKDGKGVTIQSQRRYVRYFEEYVKLRRSNNRPPDVTLMLYTIKLRNVTKSSEEIYFTVTNQGKSYKSEKILMDRLNHKSASMKWIEFSLARSPIPLHKDVKIAFYKGRNHEKMFHFWFNTWFVHELFLRVEKKTIDKASRDKKHKKYHPDLAVELDFKPPRFLPRETVKPSVGNRSSGALRSPGGRINLSRGGTPTKRVRDRTTGSGAFFKS